MLNTLKVDLACLSTMQDATSETSTQVSLATNSVATSNFGQSVAIG